MSWFKGMQTMTSAEMDEAFERSFEEIRQMRKAGQAEYARSEDNVFGNFDRVAFILNMFGINRHVVMLVYMIKHLDGIVSYITGHKSQRESVKGRFIDLITYLLLMKASVEREDGV